MYSFHFQPNTTLNSLCLPSAPNPFSKFYQPLDARRRTTKSSPKIESETLQPETELYTYTHGHTFGGSSGVLLPAKFLVRARAVRGWWRTMLCIRDIARVYSVAYKTTLSIGVCICVCVCDTNTLHKVAHTLSRSYLE